MTKGAISPQKASLKAFQISPGVPQRSPFQPFFQEMMKEGIIRKSPVIMPGKTPAAKRAGMEVPVMMP